MTPFEFFATAARTRIIPPRLSSIPVRDCVFRLIEVHRPRALRHSGSVFVNVGIFFRPLCWYVDRERLRPVVDAIGTNLCHDANGLRRVGG